MIEVTILYFGQLRQTTGMSKETITTSAKTLADLIAERADKLGFQYTPSSLRFARNEAFCDAEEILVNGDTIAFMPPMAGG